MIQPEYVRFSEESNALDYLEKTVEFIHRADTDSMDWKWVFLSLHGALYGFMICALKGTDPARVVRKNARNQWRLIDFGTALKWCQDPRYMMMTTESKVLRLSQTQKQSLDLIQNRFRNEFAHYEPRLWSIDLHRMPQVVIDGLEVTRLLSLETGNYMHLTIEAGKRIETLITEASEFLCQSRLFRESQLPE